MVRSRTLSLVGAALCGLCALGLEGHARQGDAARRISERLRALEREAADLATREKTLLTELRQLELERQIKTEQLVTLDQDVKATETKLADATARAASLRSAADASRPEVEDRIVRLYKMGRAGYWRLLLDVEDARAIGRTYRVAAALSKLDRDTVQNHAETLAALEAERTTLEAQARELNALQAQAVTARTALDRAVASRSALLKSIDGRQDLARQLAAELLAAQQKLESTVTSVRPVPAALPIQPFKGDLPWPADGIVVGRFGPRSTGTGVNAARNGVEISLAEGRPVAAVHTGIVTYAAPFTGYGNLIIVDHGNGAHSLYGHLSAATVNKGDRVEPGTNVGISGRNPAGNPALYFELRIDGKPVDPLQWLRRDRS